MKLEYTAVVDGNTKTFAALIPTAPLTVITVSVIEAFKINVGAVIVIVVNDKINGNCTGAETLPATSVVSTLKLYNPSHGSVINFDHPPVILTIPVPKTAPDAFLIVKIVHGSPVPTSVGDVLPRYDPDVGEIIVGVTGNIVSFVKVGKGK